MYNLTKLLRHASRTLPIANSWKMNTDASWSDHVAIGGVGWVVLDFARSLIGVGCKISEKSVGH